MDVTEMTDAELKAALRDRRRNKNRRKKKKKGPRGQQTGKTAATAAVAAVPDVPSPASDGGKRRRKRRRKSVTATDNDGGDGDESFLADAFETDPEANDELFHGLPWKSVDVDDRTVFGFEMEGFLGLEEIDADVVRVSNGFGGETVQLQMRGGGDVTGKQKKKKKKRREKIEKDQDSEVKAGEGGGDDDGNDVDGNDDNGNDDGNDDGDDGGKPMSKSQRRKRRRQLGRERRAREKGEAVPGNGGNGGQAATTSTTPEDADGESDDDQPPAKRPKREAKSERKAKAGKKGAAKAAKAAKAADGSDVEDMETSGAEAALDMSAWDPYKLHPLLIRGLRTLGFTAPTPIQAQTMIPAMRDFKDVFGAAETGSGKTLAFGLPILNRLLRERDKAAASRRSSNGKGDDNDNVPAWKRMLAARRGETGVVAGGDEDGDASDEAEPYSNTHLPALILAPTRELALQVNNHLKAVGQHTPLKVITIVGGLSSARQERLLRGRPDVVVATPGRYWELIGAADGYLGDLSRLRFLVLDEADRMVEHGRFEELDQILSLIPDYAGDDGTTGKDGEAMGAYTDVDELDEVVAAGLVDEATIEAQTAAVEAQAVVKRQTFLFSATLTLTSDGRRPWKRRSVARAWKNRKGKGKGRGAADEEDDQGLLSSMAVLSERLRLQGKLATVDVTRDDLMAAKLKERRIACATTEKDFYLYYFLMLHPGRTLVFVNAITCLKRLLPLLNVLRVPVWGIHAEMQQRQRLKNLDRFRDGDDAILVATDVAARGLDIPSVDHVVHYQLPRSSDLYIHRSGRTARANRDGLSVMFVAPEETQVYKKICRILDKGKDGVPAFDIDLSFMRGVRDRVNLARRVEKGLHTLRKINEGNSWFAQQAAAADMVLDDLLVDDDDEDKERRIIETKQEVGALKAQLRAMLVEPLLPSGGSTKFLSSHARFEDVMAITTRHRSLAADKTGGNRRRRKRRNR